MNDGATCLVVDAGGRTLAIPAARIDRVLPVLPAITRVPHAPRWLAGVANVMGRIVTIVDLGRLLGRGEGPEPPAARRVVVVTGGSFLFGLIVDRAGTVCGGERLDTGRRTGSFFKGWLRAGPTIADMIDVDAVVASRLDMTDGSGR